MLAVVGEVQWEPAVEGASDSPALGSDTVDLEAEIAQVCGLVNAGMARLVALVAQVLETEAWQGWGIHSPEQWVAWKCGLTSRRARSVVRAARRLGELPETRAAFEAGSLSEDQVGVVCRRAPTVIDTQISALAQLLTVAQLRRALGRYETQPEPGGPEPPEPSPEPPGEPDAEVRQVSFAHTDGGRWRMHVDLPADEGEALERALCERRDALFAQRHPDAGTDACPDDVSWADALLSMAERSMATTVAERPHHDRHLVWLHLDGRAGSGPAGGPSGRFHMGPDVSAGLRRYLSCDSRIRAVFESGGRPTSVGRAWRTVPERTRVVVEDRDGGCRVPGCERRRWLHVHHIVHWENGGATDTANLVALCQTHHRLHHRDKLGISGNADLPDGLVFSDASGRPFSLAGRPAPPAGPLADVAADLDIATAGWVAPSNERLDPESIAFNDGRDVKAAAQYWERTPEEEALYSRPSSDFITIDSFD